ncbi:hypothetical protein KIN20_026142 [Parelaphostrongylus tenuis]|uniref:Uncharacterized protein n=1 Tax=Parelaphostrongylus tenuis TaxID=148309 RepID=A0AAD5QXA8_PARTN|nr:hypothetical protein KIN20_026142 [Parelaphostrongylus tenuis]
MPGDDRPVEIIELLEVEETEKTLKEPTSNRHDKHQSTKSNTFCGGKSNGASCAEVFDDSKCERIPEVFVYGQPFF